MRFYYSDSVYHGNFAHLLLKHMLLFILVLLPFDFVIGENEFFILQKYNSLLYSVITTVFF